MTAEQEEWLDLILAEAVPRAAQEICAAYDVTTPRGVSYADRKEVTIAIIIQQSIIRSLDAASRLRTGRENGSY